MKFNTVFSFLKMSSRVEITGPLMSYCFDKGLLDNALEEGTWVMPQEDDKTVIMLICFLLHLAMTVFLNVSYITLTTISRVFITPHM